jgi:sugar lactone lactonase YvrE
MLSSLSQTYAIKNPAPDVAPSINYDGDKSGSLSSDYNKIEVLDTPYVKEYSMPNGTWPNGILVDKLGSVWTVGTKSHALLQLDPKDGKLQSIYPLKSQNFQNMGSEEKREKTTGVMMVWGIIEAPDNSIWFSQADSFNPLWRFDRNTSHFETFQDISGAPFQMKVDHKTGDIWFSTFASGTVGVIQKVHGNKALGFNYSNYSITEFPLGTSSYPSGIFVEGDSIWVTETLDNKLIKFRILKDINGKVIELVKEFESKDADKISSLSAPYDVVRIDNKLWVTEHDANFITQYDLTSNSTTKLSASSNPHQYISLPFWLREGGPDEKGLWFNEHTGNRIAYLNTTDTILTEYEIPTRNPSTGYISNALNIDVDPNDGNRIWFSEYNYDKVGVVDYQIPIPFELKANQRDVIISTDKQNSTQKEQINFEAVIQPKNITLTKTNTKTDVITFKVSSSMTQFGKLKNISASFVPHSVNRSNMLQTIPLKLILSPDEDKQISPGNYTLGISATDGVVTRTSFLNLILK